MDAREILREARRRAGVTQAQLARRFGTSQSVIVRWERGHRSPSVDTLRRLVRACGFDLELGLRPHDADTDRQIRLQLRLSPIERLEANDRAAEELATMREQARVRDR